MVGHGRFRRHLRYSLIGLFVIIALPILAFAILIVKSSLFDNPAYASQVFDGKVDYHTVLASRRWHPLGAAGWDCSYAIVALSAGADTRPKPEAAKEYWQFRFGGDWKPTPAAPLGDTTRDALDFCAQYFDGATNRALARAISKPESWYVRDSVGETIMIYSAPEMIAARIRFGD